MKFFLLFGLIFFIVSCSNRDDNVKKDNSFLGFVISKSEYGEINRIPVQATQRLRDSYSAYTKQTKISDLLLREGFDGDDTILLKVQETINQEVISYYLTSKVNEQFSAEKAKEYYDNHLDFFVSKEYSLSNILLKSRKGQNDAVIEDRANKILDQIKNGADFNVLCKEYSGGLTAKNENCLLDAIPYKNLDVTLKNTINNLKEGEVSGVVKTDRGYELFKVISISSQQLPYDDVKDKVEFQIKKKIEADELALLISRAL